MLAATALLGGAGDARGQSITTEATVTAGVSSDEVGAVATQVRGFGDLLAGVRIYADGAWAATSNRNVDAFGSAYPYSNRLQVIEAYAERMFTPGQMLFGVRGGRYRTPFGISSGSDHAYTGFLRAPLVRYDGYYALSNNFLEHGVTLSGGVPRLMAEATIGRPADVGAAVRRDGTDVIARVQAYGGPFIVGISHIRTSPYLPAQFAAGPSVFSGIDFRWMHQGVQLRGEWLTGRPFQGRSTDGWYVDAIVHHRVMGRVTAVGRVERLDYPTDNQFALYARRRTIGARIRVLDAWAIQANALHQTGRTASNATAIDVALTYSIRLN
jgi:hypothetical protein